MLYLGLSERYDHLVHHNFVFSRDAEEEFDYIYRRGEPAPDPTCYLAAPSGTEPAVAPPGGEALYVLVHTPYLRPHHDWKTMLPAYRRVILDKLSARPGMADIEERIVFERAPDAAGHPRALPACWTARSTGWRATARSSGRSSRATAARDLEGLYLAGGAAHPGPGMPMVLMSGWIAADALDRDLGGRGMSAAAKRPAGATRCAPRGSPRSSAALAPRRAERARSRCARPRRIAFFHFMFRASPGDLRAVRVARWGLPRRTAARPLVVFANHPSWWDGVAFMLLSTGCSGDRAHVHPDGGGGADPLRLHAPHRCVRRRAGRRAAPSPSCAPPREVLADPAACSG